MSSGCIPAFSLSRLVSCPSLSPVYRSTLLFLLCPNVPYANNPTTAAGSIHHEHRYSLKVMPRAFTPLVSQRSYEHCLAKPANRPATTSGPVAKLDTRSESEEEQKQVRSDEYPDSPYYRDKPWSRSAGRGPAVHSGQQAWGLVRRWRVGKNLICCPVLNFEIALRAPAFPASSEVPDTAWQLLCHDRALLSSRCWVSGARVPSSRPCMSSIVLTKCELAGHADPQRCGLSMQ